VSTAKTKVAVSPQDATVHVQLADELARQKEYDATLREYGRAIRLAPKNAYAYAQAGELATMLGDFERANKYFTQGRNVAPDDLELLLGQGDLFFKWKKYDDARATYEKGLKYEPNNPQIIWRVETLNASKVNSWRRCVTIRARAIDPSLPEAHFGMGMLTVERGNRDEARRQFQIVVSNPNTPSDLKDQAQKQLNALGDR